MASPLFPLIILLLSSLCTSLPFGHTAQTKNGVVRGKIISFPDKTVPHGMKRTSVRQFLGIPYAKPPVGPLRFKPPQPAEKWDDVLDAFSYQNSCYQVPDTAFPGFQGAEMWNPNTPVSEDCLYLNVWAPYPDQPPPPYPVMVWIYGGGFTSGTSSLPLYNGDALSNHEKVVVVSMNYRLGAFGFLSLPNHDKINGNFGLLDQQLALRWVKENIAAFGGDPSKVTIFGESAGAASVGYHLLSPGSKDLFQRAIMQSASPNAPWAQVSQETAWKRSKSLLQKLGCPLSPTAKMEACLQKVKAEEIAQKQFEVPGVSLFVFPFVPVVDGKFLHRSVQEILNGNDLPKKELLIGLNQDEGTYFMPYGPFGFSLTEDSFMTRDKFLQGISTALPDAGIAVREAAIFQYTDWTDQLNVIKNRDNIGFLYADCMFNCPVMEFVQRYSQAGGRSFLYWFDHLSSVNPWPKWMGVMHGYEIEFVFGMPLNASLGYTKNEVNMTRKFMKHWANFARTGNPSIEGAAWPPYTPDKMEYVTLNYHHPETRRQLRPHECRLWNKVVPEIQKMSDALMQCSAGTALGSSLLTLLLLLTSVIFQL